MEYNAKYGKVKTGDYVVVVTNDYMHRRSDIDIGLVSDDDYVYLGIMHHYNEEPKPIRRQIGSLGCPVCKISDKDVPDGVKSNLKESIRLQKKRESGKIRRKFQVIMVREFYEKDELITSRKELFQVSTTTLPEDATTEQIFKAVLKNLNRRFQYASCKPIDEVYYQPAVYRVNDRNVTRLVSKVYLKGECNSSYVDINGDAVDIV